MVSSLLFLLPPLAEDGSLQSGSDIPLPRRHTLSSPSTPLRSRQAAGAKETSGACEELLAQSTTVGLDLGYTNADFCVFLGRRTSIPLTAAAGLLQQWSPVRLTIQMRKGGRWSDRGKRARSESRQVRTTSQQSPEPNVPSSLYAQGAV